MSGLAVTGTAASGSTKARRPSLRVLELARAGDAARRRVMSSDESMRVEVEIELLRLGEGERMSGRHAGAVLRLALSSPLWRDHECPAVRQALDGFASWANADEMGRVWDLCSSRRCRSAAHGRWGWRTRPAPQDLLLAEALGGSWCGRLRQGFKGDGSGWEVGIQRLAAWQLSWLESRPSLVQWGALTAFAQGVLLEHLGEAALPRGGAFGDVEAAFVAAACVASSRPRGRAGALRGRAGARRRVREALQTRFPEVFAAAQPSLRRQERLPGFAIEGDRRFLVVQQRGLGSVRCEFNGAAFVVGGQYWPLSRPDLAVDAVARRLAQEVAPPKVGVLPPLWHAFLEGDAPHLGLPRPPKDPHSVLSALVPALSAHRSAAMRAARERRIARCISRRVLGWARAVRHSASGPAAAQRRAYHALLDVPYVLLDPSFYETVDRHVLADILRYPTAAAALPLAINEADRAGESVAAVMSRWQTLYCPPGVSLTRARRRLLTNWPAGLSAKYARALTQVADLPFRPRTALEVLHAVVLPGIEMAPNLPQARWRGHVNLEVAERATDAEVRDVFQRARDGGEGLVHTGTTVRRFAAHAEIWGFVFDYPEPFGGRWPGLFDRALQWHREAGWGDWDDGLDRGQPLPPVPALCVSDKAVQVTPLTTVGEVWSEGDKMHHCVSSYAQSAVAGGCHLFHVELKAGRKTSHATVECGPSGHVVQAFGPCNKSNEASEWAHRQRRLFHPEVAA